MNVGVVGSTSYIASYLIKHLRTLSDINVTTIGRTLEDDWFLDLNQADNMDMEKLRNLDYLIFAAAISSPDKCKNEFEQCWKINVTETKKVIRQALKRNCKVIFFSSDAVFGKNETEIFSEKSATVADTAYGQMKKAIEDEFRDEELFKAIRLSYVVSANDKFTKYCKSCISSGEVAEVFHPFYRSCITLSDVIQAIEWLLYNWNQFKSWNLNLAGNELVSRVRMADEISRFEKEKFHYLIKIPDDDFFSDRSKIIQTCSIYLYAYGIIGNQSFSEKYKKELEDY